MHHELDTLKDMSLWCKNMFGVREAHVSFKNEEFTYDDFYFDEDQGAVRVCDDPDMLNQSKHFD